MSSPATPHQHHHDQLVTDRLVLRPWTPDEHAAVLDGRRLEHWALDFPAEGDQVIADLVVRRPAWQTTYGHRQVVDRDTGTVIGSIGLFWPPEGGSLEIGYGIVPSARRSGYATEAVRALTTHALAAPGVHTVLALVDVGNPTSAQVFRSAGYRRTSTDSDRRTVTYQRTTGLLRGPTPRAHRPPGRFAPRTSPR